jgi:cyanophycin synthetase
MGRAAAAWFDHVVLRDDEDLRGRQPGEVSGYLRDALVRGGMDASRVEILKSEPEAVRHALSFARKDDLVVIFADRIAKVAALIDFERQKEARV